VLPCLVSAVLPVDSGLCSSLLVDRKGRKVQGTVPPPSSAFSSQLPRTRLARGRPPHHLLAPPHASPAPPPPPLAPPRAPHRPLPHPHPPPNRQPVLRRTRGSTRAQRMRPVFAWSPCTCPRWCWRPRVRSSAPLHVRPQGGLQQQQPRGDQRRPGRCGERAGGASWQLPGSLLGPSLLV